MSATTTNKSVAAVSWLLYDGLSRLDATITSLVGVDNLKYVAGAELSLTTGEFTLSLLEGFTIAELPTTWLGPENSPKIFSPNLSHDRSDSLLLVAVGISATNSVVIVSVRNAKKIIYPRNLAFTRSLVSQILIGSQATLGINDPDLSLIDHARLVSPESNCDLRITHSNDSSLTTAIVISGSGSTAAAQKLSFTELGGTVGILGVQQILWRTFAFRDIDWHMTRAALQAPRPAGNLT